MQIYYEFFISATISSPKMTRDSNELNKFKSRNEGAFCLKSAGIKPYVVCVNTAKTHV